MIFSVICKSKRNLQKHHIILNPTGPIKLNTGALALLLFVGYWYYLLKSISYIAGK
jgi:hypothetical protein